MEKTFILLRFYQGGGLARSKVVKSTEEDLQDHLIEFEEECDSQNEGERIGIISKEEFVQLAKEIK
jgi:hypothetical protein